jgi:HPt (histidine-containing phosphotransfer) domain-containing protein
LNPIEQDALNQALDRMWAKFLPQLKERVSLLESAAADFSAGRLSPADRLAAHAAAHKLAGVLGTFGLDRGTVLARELEAIYSREGSLDRSLAAHLTAIAAELRTIIEGRK